MIHFRPDDINQYVAESTSTTSMTRLFLAGSIEMGKAQDWQHDVITAFKDDYIAIYNPRRQQWNAELEQTMTNEAFRYQVTWEQKYIDRCNIVLFNLLPDTYSPISLLELGQMTHVMKKEQQLKIDKEVIVVCPKDFYRRGNVEMVCLLFKIPLYESLQEGIAHIKTTLQFKN